MYFSNHIKGVSDVVGATHTGQTFYFADVPSSNGFSSYLTILNRGTNTATVKASYSEVCLWHGLLLMALQRSALRGGPALTPIAQQGEER
jgi:hypothetical protein